MTEYQLPKPIIGITTTRLNRRSKTPAFGTNIAYTHSVLDAGGIPVLIPSNVANQDLDHLLTSIDGLLFTGGSDLDPSSYGISMHPKVVGVDADRDRVEIYLVTRVIRVGMPFFGICRGCQVINVALGGSLYPDLAEQAHREIQHDNHDLPRDYLAHTVQVQTGSVLVEILGDTTAQVNSLHHQGINLLASDLRDVAHARDGLVEAVELTAHPFGIAVQWHPEELQQYAPMQRLFQSFIQACQVQKPHLAEGKIQ
jgi:putative glutamine amidotransferase